MSSSALLARRPLLGFFFLSYLISWVLWLPLLYGHFIHGWSSWEGNVWSNGRAMLGILGALGPALAAVVMTHVLEGKAQVGELLRQLLKWRVGVAWWLVALFGWWLLSSVMASALQLAPTGNVLRQALFALVNVPALIFILQVPALIGMVGEEVGWRGFALPKLLSRHDPIVSSLILGLAWLFWHAPLAVFPAWRGNMAIGDFAVRYALVVLPLTFAFTWMYQKVRGSLLLLVVLHAAFNLTFNNYPSVVGMTAMSAQVFDSSRTVVLWLIAGMLAIHYVRAGKRARAHEPTAARWWWSRAQGMSDVEPADDAGRLG